MTSSPCAIVIRTAGTNCDGEMVRGFEGAGARTSLIHLERLAARPALLDSFDLIGFAGGFSYGDDCGAGRVQALKIRASLLSALHAARDRGVPMIGACNGFQVLVQTGLLPGGGARSTALAANAGGRFIDDWVGVRYEAESVCVWTAGLSSLNDDASLMLPIAHGEGRFLAASEEVTRDLSKSGQIALRYRADVNGSTDAIAGICDPTGRIFGLMPHPERFLSWHNHPWWTRLPAAQRGSETPGLRMFRNAVLAVAGCAAA